MRSARTASLAVLLLIGVTTVRAQTLDADQAAARLDFDRARELYRAAMDRDPDLKQRDRAAVRLGNIEWRLDRDAAAAERDLARVGDDSEQAAAAWIERARLAAEVREDFAASAAAAQHAIRVAKQPLDLGRAVYFHAAALIEPVRRARLEGRCGDDAANIGQAKLELAALVAKAGPIPAPARLLLDAALLSNDGAAALAAWRGYYGPAAQSSLLAGPAAVLAEGLSSWRSSDVPPAQRRAVGLALADSRFFTEAVLVLRDPCVEHGIDAGDARVKEIVAYEATTRAFARAANEYYRNTALHRTKPADLEKIVSDSGHVLWNALSWAGKPETYSETALQDALSRLFGAYVSVGFTGKVFDVHLAHRVIDEQREVTQYGHSASLHFISVDGIISNGFWSWINDGRSGDGGWASATAVYQVRPLYAAGPYDSWLKFTDPEARAQNERAIEDESWRDEERLAHDADLIPTGVALRLRRQYIDGVLRDLEASHLEGVAKRDAFVARVTHDAFESSIWAHEGRHAIDKKDHLVKPGDGAEMEFRAKLSEIALAPAPRHAIESITYNGPPNTPHGAANRRIGRLLNDWMRAHAAAIEGLDPNKAMLLQVDKLTDDQLRQAFRSMDPLAR